MATTGLGLTGARVLVTGGGTGIGQGIAEAFGAEGARVAITYHRHEPDDALHAACPGPVSYTHLTLPTNREV